MPNLNKTQKKFKKEIQELENNESYKNIMYDHDSFYNNKAYLDETKYKPKDKLKTIHIFYFFIFLLFIVIIINFKNIQPILNYLLLLVLSYL